MKKNRIKLITKVGIFSAIAFVLQVLGSMFPKVAGFLEIEFSDLPALIISLALGPWAGVAVEFIKNLLHCTIYISTTSFVGEFANFAINGTFVFVCGLLYQRNKTKRGAIFSLIIATIALVLIGVCINVFVMLPLYMKDAGFYDNLKLAIYTIAPFNLVRGTILSLITIFIYKRISRLLK